MNKLTLFFTFLLFVSCKPDFSEGEFCAEVTYFYPKTNTHSNYNLIVETKDNKVIKINWNNGGWLDETHFTPPSINKNRASFTSDKGVEYTIVLIGDLSECNSTQNGVSEEDFLNEEKEKLCLNCGKVKDIDDEYCKVCKLEKEKIYVYGTVDFKYFTHINIAGSLLPKLEEQGKSCTPVYEIHKDELERFRQSFISCTEVQYYNYSNSSQKFGYFTYPKTIDIKTFKTMEEANKYQLNNCERVLSTFLYVNSY